MATVTTPEPAVSEARVDHVVELPEIGWDGFEAILRMLGERRRPRKIYLDESLTLMSPSMPHDSFSRRLCFFVMEVTSGLDIPCIMGGSTTWKRRDLNAAVEGDETFFTASVERIRSKADVDLSVDPPPDLAIEVVVTHPVKKALEVYCRLGVPEVWVCTPKGLRFLRLGEDGQYRETGTSAAFPFLAPAEVFAWVDRPTMIDEAAWLNEVRAWVRDELAPRVRGGG